ncbi:MAG: S8 family peptidase [Patescibacteria group bacterium]|nr:MAG: S8 family peptidase [Patescibacteria group bacterium]
MVNAVLIAITVFATSGSPALAAEPNDPLYGAQWYAKAIGLPEAWNFAKGSPTVRVAILDTGIDLSHPDLKDRFWTNRGEVPNDGIDNDRNGYIDDVRGWDFVDRDNDPNPDLDDPGQTEAVNHGTLVAGLIGAAGNNNEGVAGINWNIEMIPLRVLDGAGSGRTDNVEAAIRYAIAQKVDVINLSFSGAGYSNFLVEAMRDAYRAGIVVVVAAGNEGDTERGGNLNVYPSYPVCYRGALGEEILIGVSALDGQDRHSSFSSYGLQCITVSAPGENIMTTQVYRPGQTGYTKPYGSGWSGSSLAAPLVSGLAALLLSINPALTPAEVRVMITAHAKNVDALNGGFAGQLGAGRIDAAASVQAVVAAMLAVPVSEPPAQGVPAPLPSGGELVKSPASSAVYYKAQNGKRYVFPNANTYATWFQGFAAVKTISVAQLASLPIGGTVTYRPGTRLLKLQTRPEVYAVGKGGVLRHLASEDVAREVFGSGWQSLVDDLPEAFFAGYRVGPIVVKAGDFVAFDERASAPTIEADRNL